MNVPSHANNGPQQYSTPSIMAPRDVTADGYVFFMLEMSKSDS